MANGSTQYEFTPDQDAVFTKLATRMRGVGFWFELYGGIMIGSFVYKLIPKNEYVEVVPFDLFSGVIFLLIGHWTRRGGRAFQNIAATRGRDIDHVMNAAGELSKMYWLIDRLIFWALVLVIVAIGFMTIFTLKGKV